MRDGRDCLVPEHLEHIFAVREKMDEFAIELRGLQRQVHRAAAECPEAWVWFDFREFDDRIRSMTYAFAWAKPHAVCPTCRGVGGPECPTCGGRQWLSRWKVKQLEKHGRWVAQ